MIRTAVPAIPVGLGFLAAGLVFTAAEVALIRNRRNYAQRRIDYMEVRDRIPGGIRWMFRGLRDSRWYDEDFRAKHQWRLWLPFALQLAIVALICLTVAVVVFGGSHGTRS